MFVHRLLTCDINQTCQSCITIIDVEDDGDLNDRRLEGAHRAHFGGSPGRGKSNTRAIFVVNFPLDHSDQRKRHGDD